MEQDINMKDFNKEKQFNHIKNSNKRVERKDYHYRKSNQPYK
jgi:hypothetical protein